MKGRWRKDKKVGGSSGGSAAFTSGSACMPVAQGDEALWSLRQLSLYESSCSSCSTESGNPAGHSSGNSSNEHSSSSKVQNNNSKVQTSSNDACGSSVNKRRLRSRTIKCTVAPLAGVAKQSNNSNGKTSNGTPAAPSLLGEDVSYFSRRRLQAAADEECGAASTQPTHFRNAAYAAAQSLRQSEQLLCDGAARAALKQALEGGSIYIPAFCCSHGDFSIFEALMKDLLLFALQQQEEKAFDSCRQVLGDEKKRRAAETAVGRGEEGSRKMISSKSADTRPVSDAAAAARRRMSDSHGVSEGGEDTWRQLLRPETYSESKEQTGKTSTARTTATADINTEKGCETAARKAAMGEVVAGDGAAKKAAAGDAGTREPVAGRAAATREAAAGDTGRSDAAAAAGDERVKGGVVNWSCHLKHEDPSFSRSFQSVVEKLSTYFCVEVYASRLNMYMDGSQWKPLHHDSHAYSSHQQQREDFTVGASFGATRALEFVHVRPTPHNNRSTEEQSAATVRFLFPQRNGDVFAFNSDVNKRFKHGVPPASAPRFPPAKPAAAAASAAAASVAATRIQRDSVTAAGTAMMATLRMQEEAKLPDGLPVKRYSLDGKCSGKEGGASAATATTEHWEKTSAAAEAAGSDARGRRARLEEIAAKGAAAAARAAAAATDGNGPRFSVIIWGRRKQLNERNASLKELAAVHQAAGRTIA